MPISIIRGLLQMRKATLGVFFLAGLGGAAVGLAQTAPPDLSDASLEDLMNIQVTSVSRKEQSLSKVGAAVFVITQEDIRRSGATNIPDLLRLAPGVDVARDRRQSMGHQHSRIQRSIREQSAGLD